MADLDPARGSGANKWRPAVIVSNDRANASAAGPERGVVTIVPVTSNVTRVYPIQTLMPSPDTGLRVDSKAHAEQVRSDSIERIGAVIGRVPSHVMGQLDDALRAPCAAVALCVAVR